MTKQILMTVQQIAIGTANGGFWKLLADNFEANKHPLLHTFSISLGPSFNVLPPGDMLADAKFLKQHGKLIDAIEISNTKAVDGALKRLRIDGADDLEFEILFGDTVGHRYTVTNITVDDNPKLVAFTLAHKEG